uniref:Uncharacterized protein n=1 Tax=Canis lupus dingo TaxID=286419 RepID=A0A8C0R569_CANLU
MSLTSETVTVMLCWPPSNAVRVKMSSGCSSRSSALSSTSSGYFLPSLRLRVRTWKWELGVTV